MFLDPSPWVDGKQCRLGDGGVVVGEGGGLGQVKKEGVCFKFETWKCERGRGIEKRYFVIFTQIHVLYIFFLTGLLRMEQKL